MMKSLMVGLMLGCLLTVTGCDTIKGLFPDKVDCTIELNKPKAECQPVK